MARHSTSITVRCARCETTSCPSCTQLRLHAWRLTEHGLTVEQTAARMRLPAVRVEYLLAVERERRDLQRYKQKTIPATAARGFVDRHLERHPELTRAAIAHWLGKTQSDLDRQLGYIPHRDGHIQQTIGIPAASQLMIALGRPPNDLDGS